MHDTFRHSCLATPRPKTGPFRTCFETNSAEMKGLRRQMQIIFQDPYASLDPRQTVSSLLHEAMIIHGITKNKYEAYQKSLELLRKVGSDEEHLYRFPHEFSGGRGKGSP